MRQGHFKLTHDQEKPALESFSYWFRVCGVDREVHATAGREAGATCSCSYRQH
jgi:hypothetical protein